MAQSKPESDRKITTDPDINAYQGYLPDEWGPKVIGPIPEGTVLERLLLDLAMAWRSASYTAQMPATAVRAMHAATAGLANYSSNDASIADFADKVIGKLAEQVPELHSNRTLSNKLVNRLNDIATGFRDRARQAKLEVPIEPMWASFMQQVSFRISLWSSQRISYAAFFNAYEAFLVDTLKVGLGVSSLRVTTKKEFNEALRTALGTDISGPCWRDIDLLIPRLVRHALSHNGGRVTSDLSNHQHGIALVGKELQIFPADLHRMLKPLLKAAERIVDVTKDNPKFQAPAAKLPLSPEDE